MRATYTRTKMDGFRLHAVHRGDGRPVILLHGLSGSHRWWRFTVPALEGRFRVHIPEMVGFGGSRGAERQPSIPEMAELFAHWLDALEIERTAFVGHSMGAQVGVHLAARWPERIERLVLISAAGVPRSLSPVKAARLAADLAWPRAWGLPTFLPTIAADAVRAGPRTLLTAIRHLLDDDVRPLLERIEAPTLLIWGEHDPLTPLSDGQLMARRLPDARLVVLKGAAHNPMADRPARFNQELLRFLTDGHD